MAGFFNNSKEKKNGVKKKFAEKNNRSKDVGRKDGCSYKQRPMLDWFINILVFYFIDISKLTWKRAIRKWIKPEASSVRRNLDLSIDNLCKRIFVLHFVIYTTENKNSESINDECRPKLLHKFKNIEKSKSCLTVQLQ